MFPSIVRSLALALAASLVATPILAQGWPSKPVRFVVPFPPGGTVDLLAHWGKIVKDNGIKID